MRDNAWVSSSLPYLTPPGKGQPGAWQAEAAGRGGKGTQRIVYAGEVTAPEDVAAALRPGAGEPAVSRHRLLSVDGEPVELVTSCYPPAVARGTALAEPRKIRGGTPALLRARRGVLSDDERPVEAASARMLSPEVYRLTRSLASVCRSLPTIRRPFSVLVAVPVAAMLNPHVPDCAVRYGPTH